MKLILKIGGETYKVTAPEVGYKALLDWAHDIDVTFCTALGNNVSSYIFELDEKEEELLRANILQNEANFWFNVRNYKQEYYKVMLYPEYNNDATVEKIGYMASEKDKNDLVCGVYYDGVITTDNAELYDKLSAIYLTGGHDFKLPFKKLK